MILQKSARFLVICLCAIIFHGNVFGDSVEDYCAENGFGEDKDGHCDLCTNFVKVKDTKTLSREDCDKENYDFTIEGDDCIVNIHECTDCTEVGYGVVDDACVTCDGDKYALTIPEDVNMAGGVVPAYNICVAKQDSMVCKDGVCTCKAGYYVVDDSEPCWTCFDGYFSNDTTGGKCDWCAGVVMKENNLNVGCKSCGDGQEPNNDHSKCVCKDEYFLDSTKTKCVQSCEGAGIGKLEEDGVSQCVQCSVYGQSAKQDDTYGNVCTNECGGYLVDKNGTCGYCDKGMYYKADNHSCVSTCSNSHSLTLDDGTVIQVCCSANEHFNTASGQCESCAKNEWFNESCQTCPTNFSCDGNTKTKCPFGTVSASGKGNCRVPDNIDKQGFLYKNGTSYEVKTKSDYDSVSEDDTDFFGSFEYALCNKSVDGYSISGTAEVNGTTVNIKTCGTCGEMEHPVEGIGCVCGRSDNLNAGIITHITETRENKNVCQICPNGLLKTPENGDDYVCNGCSNGEGFYWNGTRYVCAKCGDKDALDTALYTDENGYAWCLTYNELKNVITEAEANKYYANKDKKGVFHWELCPQGTCCLDGGMYECNKGTFTMFGETGLVCSGGVGGVCHSCEGKTTEKKGTVCDKDYKDVATCRREMCTESIAPTKFCQWTNSKEYKDDMCFEIDNIRMKLSTGVYNTIDVTGTTGR